MLTSLSEKCIMTRIKCPRLGLGKQMATEVTVDDETEREDISFLVLL